MKTSENRLAALVALSVLTLASPGRTVETFQDVRFTQEQFAQIPHVDHGYVETRVRLDNLSVREAREAAVSLVMSYPPVTATKRVTLGPASSATLSLYMPVAGAYGMQMTLRAEVNGRERFIGNHSVNSSGYGGVSGRSLWLVSRSLNVDHLDAQVNGAANRGASAPAGAAPGHRMSGEPNSRRVEFARPEGDIRTWPEQWLAYTPYDAALVTAGDMLTMPAPARAALWRYTESGGVLVVLGSGETPEGWPATISKPAFTRHGVSTTPAGFGLFIVLEASQASAITGAMANQVTDNAEVTASAWTWSRSLTLADGHKAFAVADNLAMPTGSMFLISILFAVVVGPLNMFVLNRRNRRLWLLWTVPVISLATFGVVLVYSLMSEGVTPRVRTSSITVLDQNRKHASTIGMAAYYSPLALPAGLRFSPDTELSAIGIQSSRGDRLTDWTACQHLAGGWVSARVPALFMVRKSERRNERLEVRQEGPNSLSVLNALGADIVRLWVAGPDGLLYEAREIPAGKSVRLAASQGRPPRLSPRACRNRFATGQWNDLAVLFGDPKPSVTNAAIAVAADVSREPPMLPAANSYLALLRRDPFVEDAVGRGTRSRQEAAVFGLLQP